MPMAAHPQFMRRCLELASLGRYNVGNGALVGAVLVRDELIIAEGYHSHFGATHAERMLLESFTEPILSSDILYVNLEPCCHIGKTPPCTDIILERGIKHVVYGIQDPDNRVTGKGIELLQAKGVRVEGPILRAECEYFSRGFLTVRTKGRPHITLKMAQNRAGFISNADGSPLKITSEEQDIWSHTWLRAKNDAVVVGVQTIMSDNPLLNTRLAQRDEISIQSGLNKNVDTSSNKKLIQKEPLRIILDPQFRLPEEARVCDVSAQPTLVCISPEAEKKNQAKADVLRSRGVKVCIVAIDQSGTFEWGSLWKTLLTPVSGFDGITSILVEGGARTWQHFEGAGMVDEQVTLLG